MAFSNMSSRERTIVAVLAVIIVVALVGIGVLVARLISGDSEPEGGITVLPPATVSPIAPPSPQPPPPTIEADPGQTGQPVQLARAESAGPGAPAIIASQALQPGHRYSIEITAADGQVVEIQGSWSQGTVATQGQGALPQIEFFEGRTPYTISVVSPVPDPEMWSVAVSAGPANILGTQPRLVITIWDVTGVE